MLCCYHNNWCGLCCCWDFFLFTIGKSEKESKSYCLLGWVFKWSLQKQAIRGRLCLWYGVAEAQGSQFKLGWFAGNTEQHVLPGGVLWDLFSPEEKGNNLSEKHLPNPSPALVKKHCLSSPTSGESHRVPMCSPMCFGRLLHPECFPRTAIAVLSPSVTCVCSLPLWFISPERCTEIELHGSKKPQNQRSSVMWWWRVWVAVLRIKGSVAHLHSFLLCKELNLYVLFTYVLHLCISFLWTQIKTGTYLADCTFLWASFIQY